MEAGKGFLRSTSVPSRLPGLPVGVFRRGAHEFPGARALTFTLYKGEQMKPEKHPPARRPARARLTTLSLLLLVLACGLQARAQDSAAPDQAQEPKMSDLLKMPGKVIAESNAPTAAAGRLKVKNYRVEELTLPAPVSVEVGGRRVEVSRAFRVTVTGGPFPVRALPAVVWVDDEAVGFGVESEDLDAITAVTFDGSLLREGATLYLSYGDKENKAERTALPEKLRLNANKGGNR